MGASLFLLNREDGIVHSIWKQMANIEEPGGPGAIPGPATNMSKNKVISKREGLIIYWCEGDRPSGRNYTAAVTSSDYFIIKNFLDWLKKYFHVSNENIKLRLHLWPNSNELKAKKYWAKQLGLPLVNFTKTYFKIKSGKNKKYEYGICRTAVHNKKILETILNNIKREFY